MIRKSAAMPPAAARRKVNPRAADGDMTARVLTKASALHAASGKNLTIGRREIRRLVRFRLAHKVQDAGRIITRGPDFAEEVRGMNPVFTEEGAVAAAAIHQLRRHLAPKLGL